MNIKVKKLLFYGIKQEIDNFFNKAQRAAIIEFIGPFAQTVKEISPLIKDFIAAIKILQKQPVFTAVKDERALSSKSIVRRILHINTELEKLSEQRRILESEIIRITPFGDFSIEEIKQIEKEGHRHLQFFCVKTSKREEIELPEEMIYVGTQYDLDYFVAVNKEKKIYPNMIEIIIDKSLQILKDKLFYLQKEQELFHKELKELTGYLKFLRKELIKELNIYHLNSAKKDIDFPLNESIFSVEAWIPENKFDQLEKLVKGIPIEYEVIAIEEKDKIPTYLDNKGLAKVGEDLVNIYDVPSIKDKDPSVWVLFAFSLFFAMIVSDLGYGLLYLGIAIFLKFKFPHPKALVKRFIKLVWMISISCVIWGALNGSFFGMGVDINNKLSNVTLINFVAIKKADYHLEVKDDIYKEYIKKYPNISGARDGKEFLEKAQKKENGQIKFEVLDDFKNNILMEMSLLIGVIHIAFSFIRNTKKNWAGIGWIFFMVGGYLFFPKVVGATSMVHYIMQISKPMAFITGEYLLFSGIAVALCLAILQRKIMGVLEITNLIQIFADVLSYLRLYALGLAGMIMANTFNDIGAALGWAFGIIAVLVGHGINLALGVMGGIIHGLRLNFIEWYHYSFEGDGKLFNPLKLLK